MSLLGTPLLILLAAAAVLAPVAVCGVWSRVGGPAALRVLARGALIALAQLLAVALVAALINDYGLFYRDWSELGSGLAQLAGLGPSRSAGSFRNAGGPRTVGARLTATDAPGYRDPRRWPITGRLERVTIRGTVSRLSSPALVYLPPQYFRRADASRYFPGVEVFTGYPGIDQYLVSRLKYPHVLRDLVAEHRAAPAVLVMMRPAVTFPRDTECTDVPGGPSAETFFATDVPAQVEATYRVLTSGWGAIGDSTGGYCATKLAMLDPGTFGAAAEMSGYFFALHDDTTGDLWGGSSAIRDLNDLAWRIRHLPAPPVDLLEGTSPTERGPDGYDEALGFARLVRAPMRVSLMTVPHGGHNLATWAAELPAALSWLTARLPAPAASPSPAGPDLGTVAGPVIDSGPGPVTRPVAGRDARTATL